MGYNAGQCRCVRARPTVIDIVFVQIPTKVRLMKHFAPRYYSNFTLMRHPHPHSLAQGDLPGFSIPSLVIPSISSALVSTCDVFNFDAMAESKLTCLSRTSSAQRSRNLESFHFLSSIYSCPALSAEFWSALRVSCNMAILSRVSSSFRSQTFSCSQGFPFQFASLISTQLHYIVLELRKFGL